MKPLILTISEPTRLDVALAASLGVSRSQAQKMIKEGLVTLDGKVPTPHKEVSSEDRVQIADLPENALPLATTPPPLEILYEDADVLVVNKPSGILVHRAQENREPTLLEAMVHHAPQMKKAGEDENRSGIVHRLDKEASGVLIAAKTPTAFRFLKRQFADRLTEKHYTVLVMGKVREAAGTIRFPIARSRTRARMAARPASQEGKEAITHYTVLKRYTVGTLLDVKIETGRTHQIRAHFFALGHPVAGDTLYSRNDIKPLALPRLFLHARALCVTLPSGERKTFEAALPKELEDALKNLKPAL